MFVCSRIEEDFRERRVGCFTNARSSICSTDCAQARLQAGQHRGSDATPRCAGSAVVLAFGSCRITRFACFAALRSNRMRQIRARSTRVRAPTQTLRSSPSHTHPGTGRPAALPRRHCTSRPRWRRCPQGRGWAAAGRACEATRSRGLVARVRTRTLRDLTRSIGSTIASAASGGRYAAGPRARAPQCSRCTHRPPHRSARRLPSHGLASANIHANWTADFERRSRTDSGQRHEREVHFSVAVIARAASVWRVR